MAFPTETYYGLAVDPFNPLALERIFRAKLRPHNLPILVLVAEISQLHLLTDAMPPVYFRLIDHLWPGPLTLVCPALPSLPVRLTGGTGTVGIRQSPHPIARALLAAFGGPLTATSANVTGFPAAVAADEVARMFPTGLDLILDGGSTPGGSGSTLVGVHGTELRCLREGKIPFSVVQARVAVDTLNDES